MKTTHSLFPLTFLLTLLMWTPALSPGQQAHQRIGVYPVSPPIEYCPPERIHINLWTDRSFYDIGEEVRMSVRLTQDAYVYVFSTDARGVTRRIFPNPWDHDNYLRANRTYRFPDRSRYAFVAEGPPGREELTVVAVSSEVDWMQDAYCRIEQRDPFPVVGSIGGIRGRFEATHREGYEQYAASFEYSSGGPVAHPKRITPVPVHPPQWQPCAYGEVTKTLRIKQPLVCPPPAYQPPPRYYQGGGGGTFFFQYGNDDRRDRDRHDRDYRDRDRDTDWRIRNPTPYGRGNDRGHDRHYGRDKDDYGSISFNTWPRDAEVAINGRDVGETPFDIKLPEGNYHVEIRKRGHARWRTNVHIEEGAHERISVRLQRD